MKKTAVDLHALLIHLIRLSADDRRSLSCDKRRLGRFFLDASSSLETQALFDTILFEDTHGYPASPAINKAIQRLQLTGVLGQPNPLDMRSEIRISPADWNAIPFPKSDEQKQCFQILLTRFQQELCDA